MATIQETYEAALADWRTAAAAHDSIRAEYLGGRISDEAFSASRAIREHAMAVLDAAEANLAGRCTAQKARK